jgi:hypothetical protein
MGVNQQVTRVDPMRLREWAVSHERAADGCAAARRQHPNTIAAAQSWGPLYHEARRAAVEAVNAREATLIEQERRHRSMAAELRKAADRMAQMNEQNAAKLRMTTD